MRENLVQYFFENGLVEMDTEIFWVILITPTALRLAK